MKFFDKLRIEKGQSLIEVVVALGVAVAVLVAITSTVLTSLYNSQFSKNQNLATLYGQQGMEIVRDLKNRSWTDFYNHTAQQGATTYCLPQSGVLNQNPGSCQQNELLNGLFRREIVFIRMTDNPSGKVQVTTTVSFTDSKGEHKSELISIFTSW